MESRGTHVISLELDFASLELDSVLIDSLLELSVFAVSELSGLDVSELELAVSELDEIVFSLELDCTPLVSLELDSSLFESLLSGSS